MHYFMFLSPLPGTIGRKNSIKHFCFGSWSVVDKKEVHFIPNFNAAWVDRLSNASSIVFLIDGLHADEHVSLVDVIWARR